MKDTGTLFVRPMVDAMLADWKLMTRRAVKLPHHNPLGQWEVVPFGGPHGGHTRDGRTAPLQRLIGHSRTGEILGCPYGQPGERIWVRETFFAFGRWETRFSAKKGRDEWHFVDMTPDTFGCYLYDPPAHWEAPKRAGATPAWWRRPAIHMPRRACRLELEVVSVGVEHLQEISDADARAEGCRELPGQEGSDGAWWTADVSAGPALHGRTPRDAFRLLWESINGPDSWASNPWVWVVGFRRVE